MAEEGPRLSRSLTLPLLILYGVGVTIGAGIYVLIGAVAGHAGRFAPLSFVIAAIVMGLTVCSYAELCTRYPVAAGEPAYIKAAFQGRWLSTITGTIMIASGVIAAATVALGSTGYVAQFIDVPAWIVVSVVVVGLGIVSAWGIMESVLLASIFTVIEVAGLLIIIAVAIYADIPFSEAIFAWPSLVTGTWLGIGYASLLAFFAFTGFEDLTNLVEEAKSPERNIPIAMAVTLVITTVLYVLITAIAVVALQPKELSASAAPLSLVYRKIAGFSPALISAIAIVATLNTIIAQMTMATRVVYGMARQGDLPRFLGTVNRATATPGNATALIILMVLCLALFVSFEKLAEFTSLATLVVFVLVNLALIGIRWKAIAPAQARSIVRVPILVPWLGLASCVGMIAMSLYGE